MRLILLLLSLLSGMIYTYSNSLPFEIYLKWKITTSNAISYMNYKFHVYVEDVGYILYTGLIRIFPFVSRSPIPEHFFFSSRDSFKKSQRVFVIYSFFFFHWIYETYCTLTCVYCQLLLQLQWRCSKTSPCYHWL